MEDSSPDRVTSGRPPIGIFTSRCDEKGRLRLPKEIEDFLRTFPDPEFFITTLNLNIARIYPIRVWMENENVLSGFDQDPDAAEDIAFLAHYWGAVSTIDAQGRVLVPPGLRRKLGIEDQKVNLRFYNGAVDVYNETESERRLGRATEALGANLPTLRKRGLK
jgi:DNA-binding transcriptional regulator/RsmH inhibitor MraZ